jgi:hypothetical protein
LEDVIRLSLARLSTLFAAAAAFMLLYTAIGLMLFPVLLKEIAVQELTKFLGVQLRSEISISTRTRCRSLSTGLTLMSQRTARKP